MNPRFVIALLCLSGAAAFPQGQLLLDNRVNGVVVAPIYGPAPANPELSLQGNSPAGFPAGIQTYAGALLSGQEYSAQLFAGPTDSATDALEAVEPIVHFRVGPQAGSLAAPDFAVTIPGVPEGVAAKVQLRAWLNDNGRVTNWSQVRTNSWIPRGVSIAFATRPLGRSTTLPPNLEGLRSFNLSLPSGVAARLPPAPVGLGAQAVTDSTVDLTWQAAPMDVLGFRVEHSLDGIGFVENVVLTSNTVAFRVQNLKPAIRHHFRMRAFNAAGESAYSAVVNVSTPAPFAYWRTTRFPFPNATNDAVSGAAADPDGDGLLNFGEYVFESNPLQADRTGLITGTIDRAADPRGFLAATYSRNRAAIDAIVRARVSSDLGSWPTASNDVIGPLLVGQTESQVTEMFRDTVPVSSSPWRLMQLEAVNIGLRDIWETRTAMPVALESVACGIIGQRLYVIGGGNNATVAYDFGAGKWTNLAVVRPFPGSNHGAETIDNRLYLFGGLGPAAGKMQIYDPATNRWTAGPPLPFLAGACATAIIQGRLYLAGPNPETALSDVLVRFDFAANVWTNLAPMPQSRILTAAGTDGTRFFVFGGRGIGSSANDGSDSVLIYDPASNAWTSSASPNPVIARLPQARAGMGKAVYLNGDFFVIGGETTSGSGATPQGVYNRVDIYHVAANAWSTGTPMLTARHGIFPVLFDGQIHVVGGGTVAGSFASAIYETYSLP